VRNDSAVANVATALSVVDTPTLTVVVPAYKEASRIEPTLQRISEYGAAQPWKTEIIVVLDGGPVDTAAAVARAQEKYPGITVLNNGVNRGKGYSVRTGMLVARGRYVLFSDADLSTPIEESARLISALDAGADVAIGSRALAQSRVTVHQPWWRESMGRTFNWFVQRLAVQGISDTQCGFKCFRQDAARRIFALQRLDRFAFDVEVLWIAQHLGLKVVELPVTWVNSPASTVNPIRDSSRMLVDLLRIRVNHWGGHYNEKL
jgi:glycosyltransferase involved in cell wall biosynthesis